MLPRDGDAVQRAALTGERQFIAGDVGDEFHC